MWRPMKRTLPTVRWLLERVGSRVVAETSAVCMGSEALISHCVSASHDQQWIWNADDFVIFTVVFELAQEVPHRIESAALLIIGLYRDPWGVIGVRVQKHELFRLGVGFPPIQRFQINRRQLPSANRV